MGVEWLTVVHLEGLLIFREFCEFGNTHYSSDTGHSSVSQVVILQVLSVSGGAVAQVSVRDELCKTNSICLSIEDKHCLR